jgi:ElaB/YqjD/DUF883 family membrane-anchored ribosome-binding protein
MAARQRSTRTHRAPRSGASPKSVSHKASHNGRHHTNRVDGFIRRATDLGIGTLRTAEKGVGEAGEKAASYVKAGRRKARRWEQSAESLIERQPVMSVLVIAVVGCLLAFLFSRRN